MRQGARNPEHALVLLVEDNEDDIYLTLRALNQNGVPSEDVAVVHDGTEALDYIFARGPYADRDADYLPYLILLDINLPGLSGQQVLKQLKLEPRTRAIPIVMLTSSREERDLVEGYDTGVNSYVLKPVVSEEFDEVIQTIATYWLKLNEQPR